MSDTYTTFKKFLDPAEAKKLQQLLLDNNIESLFIDVSPSLGSSFGGDLLKEYEIQVKPSDFERAEQLLDHGVENLLNDIPEDYYLLTFTDDELYEVIVKRDEWGGLDYMLARHLLAQRGKAISPEAIEGLQKQRLAELAKPEKNHNWIIIAGYVCALLGGLFGITTGYVISTAKKTLPNGVRVHTYTAADRAHGKIILILGIAVLALLVTLRIVDNE